MPGPVGFVAAPGPRVSRPKLVDEGEQTGFEAGTNGAALTATSEIFTTGADGTGTWLYDSTDFFEGSQCSTLNITASSIWTRSINALHGVTDSLSYWLAFKVSGSLPSAAAAFANTRGSGTNRSALRLGPTGTVQLRDAAVTVYTTTLALSLDTWYFFIGRVDSIGSRQSIEVYSQTGVLLEASGWQTYTTGGMDIMQIGAIAAPGVACVYKYDSVGYSPVGSRQPPTAVGSISTGAPALVLGATLPGTTALGAVSTGSPFLVPTACVPNGWQQFTNITGLLPRQYSQVGSRAADLRGVVADVNWSDLQPDTGGAYGPLATTGPAITEINNALATGLQVRIRVHTGTDAPQWVKDINGVGTYLTICDPSDGSVHYDIPQWWTSNVQAAWVDLMQKMARRYDKNVQVAEIASHYACTIYVEPFQRGTANTTTMIGGVNAGLTNAQVFANAGLTGCVGGASPTGPNATDAASVLWPTDIDSGGTYGPAGQTRWQNFGWNNTQLYLPFNPFQQWKSTDQSSVVNPGTWTETTAIPAIVASMGARVVLANNSLRVPVLQIGAKYLPVYNAMFGATQVAIQTANQSGASGITATYQTVPGEGSATAAQALIAVLNIGLGVFTDPLGNDTENLLSNPGGVSPGIFARSIELPDGWASWLTAADCEFFNRIAYNNPVTLLPYVTAGIEPVLSTPGSTVSGLTAAGSPALVSKAATPGPGLIGFTSVGPPALLPDATLPGASILGLVATGAPGLAQDIYPQSLGLLGATSTGAPNLLPVVDLPGAGVNAAVNSGAPALLLPFTTPGASVAGLVAAGAPGLAQDVYPPSLGLLGSVSIGPPNLLPVVDLPGNGTNASANAGAPALVLPATTPGVSALGLTGSGTPAQVTLVQPGAVSVSSSTSTGGPAVVTRTTPPTFGALGATSTGAPWLLAPASTPGTSTIGLAGTGAPGLAQDIYPQSMGVLGAVSTGPPSIRVTWSTPSKGIFVDPITVYIPGATVGYDGSNQTLYVPGANVPYSL